MPAGHTIRIEHGDQYKDEVFAEQVGPCVLLIEEEADDAIHGEAGGRFDGVNSGRDEDDRFVAPKLGDFLVTERKAFGGLEPFPALVG